MTLLPIQQKVGRVPIFHFSGSLISFDHRELFSPILFVVHNNIHDFRLHRLDHSSRAPIGLQTIWCYIFYFRTRIGEHVDPGSGRNRRYIVGENQSRASKLSDNFLLKEFDCNFRCLGHTARTMSHLVRCWTVRSKYLFPSFAVGSSPAKVHQEHMK